MPGTKQLRRDLTLVNTNAAVWAVGNGLVSSTLVIYLALELGAPGAAIGLILAAKRFAGVLRLAAPVMLGRLGRRKPLCIGLLAASSAVLIAMPALAAPQRWESVAGGVGFLVFSWCLYHLLEYLGVVLLWSWLNDLMPPPIQGRLIGRRESWLVIGRIIGLAASFGLVSLWGWIAPDADRWEPLAWSAMIGALFLLASVLPLVFMSASEQRGAVPATLPWREMLVSLTDRRYRRLLIFSCGFAVANGITASAQALYPWRVLGISYPAMLGLRGMMRTGQAALAPVAGWWLDRRGARAMLVTAQLIVATGPLFFFVATPQAWWLLGGAFVVWIAYAPMNVGLDHLKLSLAPPGCTTPALAVYYALSDLTNGVVAVLGGILYDRLSAGGANTLQLYGALFLAGWALRSAVAALLLRIDEPPSNLSGDRPLPLLGAISGEQRQDHVEAIRSPWHATG
ncbi:MAG: MFS transporter [Planctomycetota bacterium]